MFFLRQCINCLICLFILSSYSYAKDIEITTSFSILQDITKKIVKDKAIVHSIVPYNTDSHGYSLTPKNIIDIEKSDLLIINGLGFEGYLEKLIENSKISNKTLIASNGIKVLSSNNTHNHEEHSHHNGHSHQESSIDPHAWQNPLNIIIYVDNINNKLCEIDKINCEFYTQNSIEYKQKLSAINDKYSSIFNNIEDNKVVLTTHNAFTYLGNHYNITFYSPLSTNNESPSAKKLAELKRIIKENNIKYIFTENNSNNTIIETIAKDYNLEIKDNLLSDSLENEEKDYLFFIDNNLNKISSSFINN